MRLTLEFLLSCELGGPEGSHTLLGESRAGFRICLLRGQRLKAFIAPHGCFVHFWESSTSITTLSANRHGFASFLSFAFPFFYPWRIAASRTPSARLNRGIKRTPLFPILGKQASFSLLRVTLAAAVFY